MTEQPQISKDEQIGIHKGSLNTLAKEREELARMLNIVEQIMQMHMGALKELGVDLEQMASTQQAPPEKKKPIEDIL
jgi:thiaminase